MSETLLYLLSNFWGVLLIPFFVLWIAKTGDSGNPDDDGSGPRCFGKPCRCFGPPCKGSLPWYHWQESGTGPFDRG